MTYKLGTMPAVRAGGVPIHYEVIGLGRPIVLVHGFSSSFDRDWQRSGWVDFLVGDGRRVSFGDEFTVRVVTVERVQVSHLYRRRSAPPDERRRP
jgi:hypothetical protein